MSGLSGGAALVLALRAEGAKLRRARVVTAALLVPAAFITLKAVAFAVRGETGLGGGRYSYEYFFSIGAFLWERMLVPLLAVAVCAWVVWVEDDCGHWKVLLAQPLPRGAVYVSKLAMAWASVFFLQGCWWIFHSLCGRALGLNGGNAIEPAGAHAMRVAAAMAPLVAGQVLLSVLIRSPFIAIALGVVGNTASVILADTPINYWHPWGLAQVAGGSHAGPWAVLAALGTAVGLAWAGAFRLARGDV